MSDEIDRAQAINEAHQREALAAHYRRQRLPEGVFAPTECDDCGEQISEARMRAVPGCLRCVHCQTAHERALKQGG